MNLDHAIADAGVPVDVRWHPFLLRPNIPAEGVPKAPDTPENPRVPPRMKQAGKAAGVDFTGKCDRYPSTLLAHVLLHFAGEQSAAAQHALKGVLFRAYYTDGVFPDEAGLLAAAAEVGLDLKAAKRALRDQSLARRVLTEERHWKERGIHGVPFFLVNGEPLGSGAQPPEVLREAIAKAAA